MSKKNNTQKADNFDSVEEALSRTEQYIEENKKSLTIIITVMLIVIGGYLAYKNFYLAPKESEAQKEMFMAERYFELDSFQLALDGDIENLGFIDIIDNYGITKSANLANYYTGISYLHLGEFDEAISYLKKFDSDDRLVSSVALGAIGDAYVELGKLEDGASFYLKAANKNKNDFTSSIYLKKAGLVYENLEQYPKALKAYTTIQLKYPASDEARDIEKYIAGVEARL